MFGFFDIGLNILQPCFKGNLSTQMIVNIFDFINI